jgi:hypothetical protein
MMRSIEFLALASELLAAGGESRHRAAAGRAYYGAFHFVKELMDAAGVFLPASAEAHRKMQLCLKESQVDAARRAGDKLELLRTQRNRADYDLRITIFQSGKGAATLISEAQEVVALLGNVRAEPAWSAFRTNVRSYASQILRLPIST